MSNRIFHLSAFVADQIAAGEVVERPASIVKELIENSLDADASRITLDVEQGGVKRVQVQDNGSGIHADDLTLAVARPPPARSSGRRISMASHRSAFAVKRSRA